MLASSEVIDPGYNFTENALVQESFMVAIGGLRQPRPLSLPVDSMSNGETFVAFFKLGVEHILLGLDHLLFLAGLLAVARGWRSVLIVVTTFTVAHSCTLGLATFDIVSIPGRWTEPLIAASILWVGVENLLRKGEPGARWLVTFSFGLMHGFGFASVLRDLGLGQNDQGIALPLFSFNLGVEIGQLAVAALIVPSLWRLSTRPDFRSRWQPLLSGTVALAGAYWLVQRLWLAFHP